MVTDPLNFMVTVISLRVCIAVYPVNFLEEERSKQQIWLRMNIVSKL